MQDVLAGVTDYGAREPHEGKYSSEGFEVQGGKQIFIVRRSLS
jgi:hypothetical protein